MKSLSFQQGLMLKPWSNERNILIQNPTQLLTFVVTFLVRTGQTGTTFERSNQSMRNYCVIRLDKTGGKQIFIISKTVVRMLNANKCCQTCSNGSNVQN